MTDIQVSRRIEDGSGKTGIHYTCGINLTKDWTPSEYLNEMQAMIWSHAEPIVDFKESTWTEVTHLRTRVWRCVEDFVADFLKQDLHRHFGQECAVRGHRTCVYKALFEVGLNIEPIETINIKGLRVNIHASGEIKDLDCSYPEKTYVKVAGKVETLFIPIKHS